jgi:hypothetical protein
MVDLDNFDPMGKQWEHAKDDFLTDGSSEEIADEALRVAAAMLRACGGCSILPQLHESIWEFYKEVSSQTLWSPTLKEANYIFQEKIDLLSKAETASDKRIETVAIRSTMKLALQLKGSYTNKSYSYSQLRTQLGALIIKDLVGHSFLDVTRALSVGRRFGTNQQAFQFFEEVMDHIEPGAIGMGRRLAKKPTAERLQRFRIVKEKHTTSSMLYSDEFSVDL